MDTFYIDVYFFINLTADMMSLYFASIIARAPTSKYRLLLVSIILAIIAVISVLFDGGVIVTLSFYLLSIIVSFIFSVKKTSFKRRVRFFSFFSVIMMLLGGIVNLIFRIITDHMPYTVADGGVNRKFLVMSLTILLTISIIKMVSRLFTSETNTKFACIRLELMGRAIYVDALVDSGNLLKDPIDLTPVMLLKERAASALFPYGIPTSESESLSVMSKYIRLIPVKKAGKSEIEIGIRTDRASVVEKGKESDIKLTIIIDKETGSFGGYEGLIPAAALDGK